MAQQALDGTSLLVVFSWFSADLVKYVLHLPRVFCPVTNILYSGFSATPSPS